MASLKSLLSSLLDRFYSKNEKSTVSILGYMSTPYQSYSGWSTSNKYYTIPENGWLYVSCRAKDANQYLNVNMNGVIVQEVRSTANTALLVLFVPVVKGITVGIDCSVPNVAFECFRTYKNIGTS